MRAVFALCLALLAVAGFAASQSPVTFSLQEEFKDVEPFVRFLEQHGLTVSAVDRSDLPALAGDKAPTSVGTERGEFDIVILPGQSDAERLRVTYSRGSKGSKHVYQVADPHRRQPPRTLEVDHPLYFTMYKSWFVVTPSAVLDEWLKAKLDQDRP
jgi:hypothetical protein